MSLCRFPLWQQSLENLLGISDAVCLRFDGINGKKEIYDKIPDVCGGKLLSIKTSMLSWNPWNWREEMIRMLDTIKPDIVIHLDEDEIFQSNPLPEIYDKINKKKQIAYSYNMIAEDDYKFNKAYPSKPQVKVYKWFKGMTFKPYNGRCRLSNFNKNHYVVSTTNINHYCFYNEDIRKIKLKGTKEKLRWQKSG